MMENYVEIVAITSVFIGLILLLILSFVMVDDVLGKVVSAKIKKWLENKMGDRDD